MSDLLNRVVEVIDPSFRPNEHELRMLHFVSPLPYNHTVEVSGLPHERILHHYNIAVRSPVLIFLHKESIFPDFTSHLFYAFRINGRNLIVCNCHEETSMGDVISHPSQYTYIRLPESEEKTAYWQYSFDKRSLIQCISSYTQWNINGDMHDVLIVQRYNRYSNLQNNSTHKISTECYVKGFGIQNRNVLEKSNSRHLTSAPN